MSNSEINKKENELEFQPEAAQQFEDPQKVNEQTEEEQQITNVEKQEKAEECLKDPERCMQLKNEANQLFQKEEFDQAIDVYQEALKFCPDDDTKMLCVLYSNISICHIRMHEYEQTIEFTTFAIKNNPEFVKAYLNRAEAYECTDKLEEALEDYKKILELNPKEEKAQRKRKELEIKVQQLQEQRKDEVLKGLKDLGNTILGKFGMSLDNFKMQQNENGSYNIQFKQ